jgi:hypothetical protein
MKIYLDYSGFAQWIAPVKPEKLAAQEGQSPRRKA